MTIGIYKIINRTINKIYIGQSTNIDKRIHSHFLLLKSNAHNARIMQEDFNKGHVFEWKIVEEVANRGDLNDRESYWIQMTRAQAQESYNLRLPGKKEEGSLPKTFVPKRSRESMNYAELGFVVLKRRREMKIGQEALGRLAGISLNYISVIECGRANNMSADTVIKLARALGFSSTYLVRVLEGKVKI